jgi:hypothetical protein
LSFPVSGILELTGHFLTVCSTNDPVILGIERDDGFDIQVISDVMMNVFRFIASVRDVTIRFPVIMTESEQFIGIPGIMDPAFRSDDPGDHPQIGINLDRSFQEMLSDISGSGGVILAAVSNVKPV